MIDNDQLILLDDFLDKKMAIYDFLLPPTSDSFKKFLRHFLYVVIKFLNDSNRDSLFIRIPVQEFANIKNNQNSELQKQRYNQITQSLISCLQMFTAQRKLNDIEVIDTLDYPGNWYHNEDFFLCLSSEGKYILSSCCKDNRKTLKFYDAKGHQRCFTTDTKTHILQSSQVYRLSCANLPAKINNSIKKSQEIIELLQSDSDFCQRKNFHMYNSITYSGLATYNIRDNSLIPSLVKKCGNKWNELIDNWSSELLVAMGDSCYLTNSQHIKNRLGTEELKKVLFIGTNAPWEGIDTYGFTFQEMNRYCSHNKGKFHPIVFEQKDFPWLADTMENLSQLLQYYQDSIEEISSFRLKRFVLKFLSDARFSSESLTKIQQLDNEYVNDIFDDILQNTSSDVYNAIVNWFRSLRFSGLNPKAEFCQNQTDYLAVYRSSYKRTVKALEGVNNKIIVDIPMSLHKDENVLNFINQNHLFADISVLYYSGLEDNVKKNLIQNLQSEENVVTSDLRQEWGTSLVLDVQQDKDVNPENLIDYYIEEFYENTYSSPTDADRTVYTVHFSNSERIDLSGDVLVVEGDKYIPSTFPDLLNKNYAGIQLVYYLTPENLSELVSRYKNFPQDRNIESLSVLWKSEFYEYVQHKISQGYSRDLVLNDISHTSGIEVNRLRPYAVPNGGGRFMHPREMRLMIKFLQSESLLNDEDARYILAARNFTSSFNNSFGRTLKRGLFSYLVTGEISQELQDILDNCGVSLEDLIDSCIKKGVINRIDTIFSMSIH